MDLASYNRLGQVFCAANTAAKNVIAVTTSMTGVILHNPAGSGKNLLIANVGWAWTTAPAAVHNLGLALAAPNATAPGTLTAIGSGVLSASGLGNAAGAVGRAYDAAALAVAPVIVRILGGAAYATAAGNSPYAFNVDIDGSLMLVPGATLCFAAVTTTLVGLGSVTWVEVPI